VINRRVVLRSRPVEVPAPTDFGVVEGDVPEPAPGQALIRNLFFSLEPSIRARLDGVETYMPPIGIDDVIESPTVGKVVRSNDPSFQEGEIVYGFTSWQDYTLVSPETLLLDRLQPQADMPLSYYIGALGGSGTTAYVGLHDIGQIKQGDTVVISAAAGAVGSVAGQIARLRGCKVVGLVGSPEKASLITDKLGFDVAIDYKQTPDLAAAVREACPEGVDLYFDNVGGSTLDALLTCMKMFGRVTACGMMAGYNHHDRPPAMRNLFEIVGRMLRVQGFLLPAYAQSVPKALEELHAWVRSGDLVVLENLSHGIEEAPAAFCRLMSGQTIGKTLVALDGVT